MFANAIHVKMLNGFRQGLVASDGSGDHDHDDHDHGSTTELTSNVATNTASIASLADYWQFDTLPTDDTTATFFGPLGKIRVQSVPIRLWNAGHQIWKKNNAGDGVVLPDGFYKCLITTLTNHENQPCTTGGSFWLLRGAFDYITNEGTNDLDPTFSCDVTQTYHAHNIANETGTEPTDTGRCSIIYRPNTTPDADGNAGLTETCIRWDDATAVTTTDFVRLRFRMIPLFLE